ncbi:hypothetical protein BGW41_002014 [Actinomortierella wolfii]|nr:hypothetical protein BGW41_002014 [Actinomortierella wolfii]
MTADAKHEQTSSAIDGPPEQKTENTSGQPKKRQLFEQSTQYNHWRFTQQKLDEIRARANKDAIDAIKTHIEEERQLRLAQGLPVDDLETEMEFLTPSDEQSLLGYYERMIKQIYTHWKLKSEMWEYDNATALVYFKRFYLENTTMDFHPKDIM